jgi:hypothetical protein
MSIRQLYSANSIRIVQLNCRKSRAVLETILDSVKDSADLVLIQEPGFKGSDESKFLAHPAFNRLIPPRQGRKKRRTAMYIAKANPYLIVNPRDDLSNDPDMQVVEVYTRLHDDNKTKVIQPTVIVNMYNEYDGISRQWTVPRSLAKVVPLPPELQHQRCLIAGDMNAHHAWWNSTRPEARAAELVELMEDNNFSLVNLPDIATYHYGDKLSVLDLAFQSEALSDLVVNWAVDPDLHAGSDHETIKFELRSAQFLDDVMPQHSRYNWAKADWVSRRA